MPDIIHTYKKINIIKKSTPVIMPLSSCNPHPTSPSPNPRHPLFFPFFLFITWGGNMELQDTLASLYASKIKFLLQFFKTQTCVSTHRCAPAAAAHARIPFLHNLSLDLPFRLPRPTARFQISTGFVACLLAGPCAWRLP